MGCRWRVTKLLKETVLGETTAVVKSWKIDKRIIANMSPYPRHSRHRTKFHLYHYRARFSFAMLRETT